MGENDAHPLTDEQLDALVDELQDRLGDSTARKYGRRGVLAALGLATLGTGSASAQASGSVGTSSSPVDVFGYDVDASNSFTDPAGVTHSGELADLSDVGSGTGQWQEVNSGSNIEPIDGETIGTGTEDVDVGSVSTDRINNGRSGRFGDSIYYDPADSGPFVDLTDAANNVPAGGQLLLASTNIDIATEGTISLSSGATIAGMGWQAPQGALQNPTGSVLDNSNGSVSGPLVEFSGGASGIESASVRNLAIQHEATGAAVRYADVTKSNTQNVGIYLNDSGVRGIQYDGNSFFISAQNTAVRRYTDIGIAVEPSAGSQNFFFNCHTDADTPGAIGLRTIRRGTWVMGGEYVGNDAGIVFAAESDDLIGGGTIGTFHELRGTGITHREPGTGRCRNVHHHSPRANFATGIPELVRFESCTDCAVNLPQVGDISTAGDTVVWDPNSTRCGMRATARTLRADYTDNGGFLPYVEAVGSFNSFVANNITKGVRTFVPSYEGQGAPTPAYHDGSNWFELSSAASKFTP